MIQLADFIAHTKGFLHSCNHWLGLIEHRIHLIPNRLSLRWLHIINDLVVVLQKIVLGTSHTYLLGEQLRSLIRGFGSVRLILR